MIRKTMNSLDTVETAMVFEEAFGVELPIDGAPSLRTSTEIVDWLETHLSHQRPPEEAAAMLRRLAKSRQAPELAQDLNGPWRREQIAAIVHEILK